MTSVGRVLIFDDEFGRSAESREVFLESTRSREIDDRVDGRTLAAVRFASAQIRRGPNVENSMHTALQEVEAGWPFEDGGRWALVVLDLHFASGRLAQGQRAPSGELGDNTFGIDILREMARRWPSSDGTGKTAIPVVIFSGRDRTQAEQECNRLGALEFISRSAVGDEQCRQVARALYLHGLLRDGEVRLLDDGCKPVPVRRAGRIVGHDIHLLDAMRQCRRVATVPEQTICLRGETGTGKELLARYCHDVAFHPAAAALASARTHAFRDSANRPFIAADLANRPSTIVESTIFGADAGAYTGAPTRGQTGLVERAENGSLFLDEIGNLDGETARKLLRLMNNGEYERLGGTTTKHASCRFVVATDQPLEDMVRSGEFPAQLLARFKPPHVWLPALRERSDIDVLFDGLVEEKIRRSGGSWPKVIAPEVYGWLRERAWEQNVRALDALASWVAAMRLNATRIDTTDMLPFEERTSPAAVRAGDALTSGGPTNDRDTTPASYREMWGSLPRLVEDAVVRASEACRDQKTGRVNRTRTIQCLMGSELSPTAAKRLMKKIAKTFDLHRSSVEQVAQLALWAGLPDRPGLPDGTDAVDD